MSALYPVMIDVSGRLCLVVGGGRVALRKVIALLRAGARIVVVSVSFGSHFRLLIDRITMIKREFLSTDITDELALVIGATDVSDVNRLVSASAAARRIPCNIVDNPELCSFIVPAVVHRGDVTIAVSTQGRCPRLSRYIKSRIARALGPDLADLASYLGDVRVRVKSAISDARARTAFWETLFASDPLEDIRQNGWPAFRARIEQLIDRHAPKEGKP
jgi:siroheme synthase-like protein